MSASMSTELELPVRADGEMILIEIYYDKSFVLIAQSECPELNLLILL